MKVWKQTKIIISIISIIILITLIFISNLDNNKLGVASNIASNLSSPIFKFNNRRKISEEALSSNKDLDSILEENDRLREENEKLSLENNMLSAVKSDNLELSELLGLKESYANFVGIPAQVINKSMSNYEKVTTINVGEEQGIKEDMIVVAAKGLYGRVVEVSNNTSKVQLITDPSSNITVNVGDSETSVIAKGNLENGLVLTMLPLNFSLISDQYIYTSGSGGVFPKGIYVGSVGEIKYKTNESDSFALVKTGVDYDSTQNVLVLTRQKDEAEMQADKNKNVQNTNNMNMNQNEQSVQNEQIKQNDFENNQNSQNTDEIVY